MGPTSNVRKGAIQNAKKNATTNRPKKNKATTSAKILALIQDFSFKTKMVSQGRRRLQLLELMMISLNPSSVPSDVPSFIPSLKPSGAPSSSPSFDPSGAPSSIPSEVPTMVTIAN